MQLTRTFNHLMTENLAWGPWYQSRLTAIPELLTVTFIVDQVDFLN